jgi:hypothetical protein
VNLLQLATGKHLSVLFTITRVAVIPYGKHRTERRAPEHHDSSRPRGPGPLAAGPGPGLTPLS